MTQGSKDHIKNKETPVFSVFVEQLTPEETGNASTDDFNSVKFYMLCTTLTPTNSQSRVEAPASLSPLRKGFVRMTLEKPNQNRTFLHVKVLIFFFAKCTITWN